MKTALFVLLLIGSIAHAEDADPDLATGRKAAKSLMDALGPQLKQGMAAGGPQVAVKVCGTVAQTLTQAIGAKDPAVLGVSRVTDRFRNPANQADAADLKVIKDYRASKAGTDRVVRADGRVTYYKPLYIQALCLKCHGKPADLHPEVLKILKDQYPKDRATGYAEGDLRGLIKVRLATGK